ncbi:hypothetical protein LBMAG48_04520 [Phycisphaerae bacterium]|nr:hypothetical protein LBMAG48_04520 [Phycisphaerae bacterium]
MAFAKDRDIAVIEPTVFRDLIWMGQVITRGDCVVYGTTLEASGVPSPDFIEGPVSPGNVVHVSGSLGATYEITGVDGANMMRISRIRDLASGPELVAPEQISPPLPFVIATFTPQVEWVHGQLLEMLGLRRETVDDVTRLPESCVKNPDELVRLEVYGALQLVYSAAAGLSSAAPQMLAKASQWRRAFQDERQRVAARIDTDGDGAADVIRRFNVGQLVR